MFSWWEKIVDVLVFEMMSLQKGTEIGDAVHFFIYDTVKILILVLGIIFIVAVVRSFFDLEKLRDYLSGKNKVVGHILASFFGMLTPFCSCSAVPLFIGFLKARIPLGVTFSYLVSAPLSDAVVIALLFSIFGVKITFIYITAVLLIAIFSGLIIGSMKLENEILINDDTEKQSCCNKEPKANVQEKSNSCCTPTPKFTTANSSSCCSETPKFTVQKPTTSSSCCETEPKKMTNSITFKQRVSSAWDESVDIFKKIYLYVIIGIGIGAFIYGYVPTDFIAKYAGAEVWYAPIIGVIMGIPMYASAAGVLPLIEVLTQKGMLMGTALSFMMAVVALSLPEALILKRVLSFKLLSIFFGTVGIAIIIVGFAFNFII